MESLSLAVNVSRGKIVSPACEHPSLRGVLVTTLLGEESDSSKGNREPVKETDFGQFRL